MVSFVNNFANKLFLYFQQTKLLTNAYKYNIIKTKIFQLFFKTLQPIPVFWLLVK